MAEEGGNEATTEAAGSNEAAEGSTETAEESDDESFQAAIAFAAKRCVAAKERMAAKRLRPRLRPARPGRL